MTLEQPRPFPPTFTSIEDERAYRKLHLAAALRVFGRFGWGEGTAGHITARDPERPDHFWVNPYGMHFSLVKVSDLLLVNEAGEVIEGNRPLNRSAFAIHSRIHAARPEIVAAAHSHSVYGKAWSSLGRLLDPLNQDACAFFDDHALLDDYTGVVLDTAEGDRLAKTIGQMKALILQNHGILTVGETVDEAAAWYVRMEHSCQAQLLAEAAGIPISIDADTALLTRDQSGTPRAGWFAFQPLFDLVLHEEPDLAD